MAEYGSIEKWADALFTEQPNLEMAAEIYKETNKHFRENYAPVLDSVNKEITLLYRTYMRGMMESL